MAAEPDLCRVPFDELTIVETERTSGEHDLYLRFELTHPRDVDTPTVEFDFSFGYDPEDPWTEADLFEAQQRTGRK